MLRIAQCADSFLPITDGVGRVCLTYAERLAGNGHEVYVVTPASNAGFRGAFPFEIVDYRSAKLPLPLRPFVRTGSASLDLHYLSRIDSIPLDIVHAHGPGSAGQEAARLAARRRIPLIGSFHPRYFDDIYRYISNPNLAEAGVRAVAEFFTCCDEVWCVSHQAAETLERAGFSGHIELMPNGTVLTPATDQDILRMRRWLHLGSEPALLYVGQIDQTKNISLIFDMAALLKARGVPFQLLIVGGGPDEAKARARVRLLGLTGTVRFLGHIRDDRMLSALYTEAALTLFPAKHITAGLVVNEAAAMGTPSVVLCGSAAAENIKDGINGILCQNEAAAFADTVETWLKKPGEVALMGARARASIPQPWESVMQKVEARYLTLAERERYAIKRKRGLFRKELASAEETLEMRAADTMVRFLRQDLQHVYAYQNRPQRARRLPERKNTSLPRSTPEEMGVPSSAVSAFFAAVEQDPIARAHAAIIVKNGCVIAEGTWTPYDKQLPHWLFSLTKTVTGLAIGMLTDEELLDLDERLTDIFPDKAPADPAHPAHQFTVRHLLTMSTGSRFNEFGTLLGADWEREFLNTGIKFEPGTQFDYNSLNSYMLAAIIRKKTGLTVSEYLHPRLFEPLGIVDAAWETCPAGTEKGGWGLSLTVENVAKIGQLFLNHGAWTIAGKKRQLVSEKWIREASACQIETPQGECRHGYGYQVWMLEREGAFLFNGMFGQFVLCYPKEALVVALVSGSPKLFGQCHMEQHVTNAFFPDVPVLSEQSLMPNPDAEAALSARLAALTCMPRLPLLDEGATKTPFADMARRLSGRVYTFRKNITGLFPVMLAGVHNNFSTGIEHVVFKAEENGLTIELDEGRVRNELFVVPERYVRGTVSARGETQEIAATCQCALIQSGEGVLTLCIHFLETPFTRILKFYFKEDDVTLIADEDPSLRDAMGMLLDVVNISKTQVFRLLMPVLQRESLQHRIRTFTTTVAQGSL